MLRTGKEPDNLFIFFYHSEKEEFSGENQLLDGQFLLSIIARN